MRTRTICLALALFLLCPFASAQFVQQGNKLVGGEAVGSANQGYSVSLSSDGNTAVVGGPCDSSNSISQASVGAVWVFTRSGGAWVQQGGKLVGTGAVNVPFAGVRQGTSVSLSADGNTAIVGGEGDGDSRGAAWVFTRTGSVWSQQGNKLVGTGAVGSGYQGSSVSLSADGTTAIVGGYLDSTTGAAWVFTQSGGVWSQQGNKLVGMGVVGGMSFQGKSVSLSADGNTAIIGGQGDSSGVGAAWVFTRSGGVWTQQGGKLVGTGAVGSAYQGSSVSLSADGNTAIVGGEGDSGQAGAAWVFTRSGGVWSQQGNKLVGSGAVGNSFQGLSVSLSSDGNTAIVGGAYDGTFNEYRGAAWVFTRSGGVWRQLGNKLVGTGAVGGAAQGWSVCLSADGNTAIVGGYSDSSGGGAAWLFTRSATGIGERAVDIPQQFILAQNYPNPFNPSTTIKYELPNASMVRLSVYDILGREVSVLVNEVKQPGTYTVEWDASKQASGVYFCQCRAGNFVDVKKLVLLK